jgi:hypothetical protein
MHGALQLDVLYENATCTAEVVNAPIDTLGLTFEELSRTAQEAVYLFFRGRPEALGFTLGAYQKRTSVVRPGGCQDRPSSLRCLVRIRAKQGALIRCLVDMGAKLLVPFDCNGLDQSIMPAAIGRARED